MAITYKLQLKNISKSFPGVKALDDISIDVRPGTVHAIVGENGAGKSTLMKILNGSYLPDTGEIWIDGKRAGIKTPQDAANLGIAMVWQELSYVPYLSVEENLFLNKLPVKRGFVDWKTIHQQALQILESEDLTFDPKTKLMDLSVSDIQLLEIIKMTNRNAQIIIMDEPTSSLTQHETERLFEKINRMRKEGKTILYISHKMDEIFRLSDDVTVMRDGRKIKTLPIDKINREEIISMMVGREIKNIYPSRDRNVGDVMFEVRGLSSGKKFQNISFNVRKGEIVGFAGLVGAGRTEIMRALAGLDRCDSGEIYLEGKAVNNQTVGHAIAEGIMMATEDRRRYGLIAVRSIKENISLACLKKLRIGPFVAWKKERSEVQKYFNRMRVKASSTNVLAYTLSGGNQQKVVLAKWMMAQPKVFIMDEPTRGIDVGAKYEIYNLMNEIVGEGKSIIMISSEMPELLGVCDRIYVVHEGKISGEVAYEEFSQELIMSYATGGK